jgi:hypothetical protein
MDDTAPAGWGTAWSAALDDLELTLEETERLLSGDPGLSTPAPWTPPELGGPLPEELLTRAQTLLQRQQQVIARTTETMTGARKNKALLGKVADVAGVRRPAQAVYLDVRA